MPTPSFESIVIPTPDFASELTVGRVLGKGANNNVMKATWKGEPCVLRVPRRGCDTQQRGNSKWEYYHTAMAAELHSAPRMLAAWHVRHAKDRNWPSGLYMLQERYDDDLDSVLNDSVKRERYAGVGERITECLSSLARAGMFVYDFKPSNVVVRQVDDDGRVEARVIDYGRDFCEWDGRGDEVDHHTPHIVMADRMLARMHPDPEERRHARALVLFAVMLIQLSAVTTRQLHSDRYKHRMDASARHDAHPMCAHVTALLGGMQGRHKRVVRVLLRADNVRSVLRHYNGRRRAGTGRTLRLAQGIEV